MRRGSSGGGGGAPDLSAATGTLTANRGGTGLSSVASGTYKILAVNSGSTAFELQTLSNIGMSIARGAAGAALGATSQAGNIATGVGFMVTRSCKCVGVRFYTAITGSKTHRIRLWDNSGNLVAVANIATTGAGVYEGAFAAAQDLTAGTLYRIGVWETTATNYSKVTLSTWDAVIPARPFNAGGALTIVKTTWWVTGDVFPVNTASSECYPVEPMLDQ